MQLFFNTFFFPFQAIVMMSIVDFKKIHVNKFKIIKYVRNSCFILKIKVQVSPTF